MNWITYALLTVASWGVYGVLLHKGRSQMPMGPEAAHAGLKAFLFVCVAYALIGLAALAVLKWRGSNWSFSHSGVTWSLIAGGAGALGAFTLILALGAAAQIYKSVAAAAVMPIVFAGAPIVNTVVALSVHPPARGWKSLPLPFVLGCVLAATGAFMVAKYAPSSPGHPAAPATSPATVPPSASR